MYTQWGLSTLDTPEPVQVLSVQQRSWPETFPTTFYQQKALHQYKTEPTEVSTFPSFHDLLLRAMCSGGEESLSPLTNSENGATWGQQLSLYQVNQASGGLHWTRTGSHHLGGPRKKSSFPSRTSVAPPGKQTGWNLISSGLDIS